VQFCASLLKCFAAERVKAFLSKVEEFCVNIQRKIHEFCYSESVRKAVN